MKNNTICFITLALTLMLIELCGCTAPRSQFVLLPSPDGHVGKVAVSSKTGQATLTKAYEATAISRPEDRPSSPIVMPEEKVNQLFKNALAAQPPAPVTYILYFEPSSTTLTQESEKLLPKIVDYIRKTGSTYIGVSGHSDKVGSRDVNIKISSNRAKAVAKLLADMGVKADTIDVASHGMELPLVDTPEGVAEPRNRRVELVVR